MIDLLILFDRLKEFFRNPNSEPVQLKESDIFQYGSSDEDRHNDHSMSSSTPHTEETLDNSELTPYQVLTAISLCSSQLLVSLSASDGSISSMLSQKSPLSDLHSPPSKQEKLMLCVSSKDEQLINYVVEFQRISTESLVSRISAFTPLLERIKIGEVKACIQVAYSLLVK